MKKKIDFTKGTSGGPNDHGFDYWFGVDVPNFPPYIWMENGKTVGIPSVPKPKEMFGTVGPMLPGWKLEGILPGLAEKGAAWITKQSKSKKPFFLYLSLTSPHTPISPSARFQGKSGVNAYVDFVMETDWVVGHVMDALEKSGVADNTLVIFSTDNGTAHAARFDKLKEHGIDLNHHFKGKKAQIHEGGHRVPFVVRWPGKVKPRSTCNETICLNDFMATAADILDVKLPKDSAEDSYSILPVLTGKSTSLPNHPLVVNHDYGGRFAIRKGRWKYVFSSNSLFDLDKDPKEATNVADSHPETVQEMKATLERYKSSGRSR